MSNNNLYFAYGSNLNHDDWTRWCERNKCSPDVLKFRSIGYLPDHDICFSYQSKSRNGGVLDIVSRKGQIVPGVIFEVQDNGWDYLDEKEGHPNYYRRSPTIVLNEQGNEIHVETYRVVSERRERFVRPHPDYVDVVRKGLQRYGLSTQALCAAAEDKTTPWLVDAFFVYGTLMREEPRFPVFRPSGVKCTLLAQVPGQLLDLENFPAMVELNACESMVQGEFIRIQQPAKAIEELDWIEGFHGFNVDRTPSFFRRTLTNVDVGEGRSRQAWVYCLTSACEQPVILSGDWRDHRGSRADFFDKLIRNHARGEERQIAEAIAREIPFSFNCDTEAVVDSLLPLQSALGSRLISERKLAQASGNWTACAS